MGIAVAQPISPELVLVCPELREQALRLLPTVDPDRLFAVEPPPAPVPRARPTLVLVEQEPTAPLPVAFAAYVTEALVLGAIRGAALIALIATASFLLAR